MANKWKKYLFGSLFLGSLYKKWMCRIQKHSNLLTANGWKKAFNKAGFELIDSVGYLDRRASRWIDFLHYISVGSLISYKIFGKWVLFPKQYDLLPVDRWISGLVKDDVPIAKSAAGFFVLKK